MRDAEGLKIRLWADEPVQEGGEPERTTPESVGLNRDKGWPVSYQQRGGNNPERLVFNQILRELTGLFTHVAQYGIPPWDNRVDYKHPAFATYQGAIYASVADSGPQAGSVTAPPDSALWTPY